MSVQSPASDGEAPQPDNSLLQDPEWKSVAWGAAGALALVVGGIAVGLIEGNLLPGDCAGLSCLFSTVVLMYAGAIGAVWILVGVLVAFARRRWPGSIWRLWVLRGLAVLSWGPLVGLIIVALD